MNKKAYLEEVEKQLTVIYSTAKDGYRAPAADRHRLEGFMNAGVFLGLVSNPQLAELLESIHLNVFGKTINERKKERSSKWQEEIIDYSQYDHPSYKRKVN